MQEERKEKNSNSSVVTVLICEFQSSLSRLIAQLGFRSFNFSSRMNLIKGLHIKRGDVTLVSERERKGCGERGREEWSFGGIGSKCSLFHAGLMESGDKIVAIAHDGVD